MGLDIYLKRFEDFEKSKKLSEMYENESEKNWHFQGRKYAEITEDEKIQARKKNSEYALSIGLDENGDDQTVTDIEINSEKYPDHLFKIGYFRSSYNESGINRILENLGLMTIYDIFATSSHSYYVQPDWESSLSRIEYTIDKYKTASKMQSSFISKLEYNITSNKQALELAIKELNSESMSECYSNKYGLFSKDGIKVNAIIPGNYYGEGVFMIYTLEDDGWYSQALEIIKETIQWVLSKQDIQKYYLAFSG